MKKTSLLVSILLILAIAVAAQPAGTILLNAAGATFPYPIYSKWFDVYHQKAVSYTHLTLPTKRIV